MKINRTTKESFDLIYFLNPLFSIVALAMLFNSQTLHSQWYGELGLNSSSFSEYTNTEGQHVISNDFSRSLEISAGLGYRFQFLNNRLQWGLGLAFDQHQINARSNQLQFLSYNYKFSYIGVETDLYLKLLELGNNPTKRLSFWLRGGVGRGWPVQGVQQIYSNISSMQVDLLEQDGFSEGSNFYKYGLDFQYQATASTAFYFSITNNHSFSIKESTVGGTINENRSESFELKFLNFGLGVVHDFNLFKSVKDDDRYKSQNELVALQNRIESLEFDRINKKKKIESIEKDFANYTKNQKALNSLSNIVRPSEMIVLFDKNKTDLTLEAQVHIEALVSSYTKTNMTQSVRICGYADDQTGNLEYNKKLSAKRAQTVAELMMSWGVPASKIEWRGKGQTSAHSPTTPALNRRVEIVFE
jgi:outer membrane protein OmpA-like peptidoglycan-associated protein